MRVMQNKRTKSSSEYNRRNAKMYDSVMTQPSVAATPLTLESEAGNGMMIQLSKVNWNRCANVEFNIHVLVSTGDVQTRIHPQFLLY